MTRRSNNYSRERRVSIDTRSLLSTYVVVLYFLFTTSGAQADGSAILLHDALKEYRAGHYDKAAALLAQDLQENPDDGLTHYYLGMAKSKMGRDSEALSELEWAARLCPPEVISSLTKQALSTKGSELPKLPKVVVEQSDFFNMVGSSVSQMFGGKKPETIVTADGTIKMPPPDMIASLQGMWKQGKDMVRQGGKHSPRQSQYRSWAADIMPMGDMMMLVDKSKSINSAEWASHSDGLSKFGQAPENTPDWDFWISRYKRAFQHVLMGYLSKDASNQVQGSAACIFSIDRKGNLRGHIYASTADGVLNSCLLKTIQSLNHSRVLAFPANSRISGYNFRMTWNFGRLLHFIRAYRRYQEAIAKHEQEELVALRTQAELRKKALEEAKARAEKLKAQKELKEKLALKAKLAAMQTVKTKVMGQIMLPARPVELRAVAQSIADPNIKELPEAQRLDYDPFADISDREIMSWPDMNR